MSSFLRFTFTAAFLAAAGSVLYADVNGAAQQGPRSSIAQTLEHTLDSWLEALWNLPILHFFAPLFQSTPASEQAAAPQPAAATVPDPDLAGPRILATEDPVSACPIKPLDPIEDPDAQQLETSVESSAVVDVSNMVPPASQALERFESNVAAVGGTIILKSAYRPSVYQQHLQDVWYKWMDELRNNHDPACQDLRAQVQEEFTRHHLIDTQHPVAVSDHTRGMAFDATVDLPSRARLGRRRVTLDSLARLSGLMRPAIATDPVHFKFVGIVARSKYRQRKA